ncbi:glycosyltransferase [Ornithobacterium rhinotracheale]|uniref:glycosyltransferase family 2 protein n=1 Tax=Ornithobacterium rhinotracheale TaxID=28251 RepID=UPI003872ED60
MNTPPITIFTPAYNRADLLSRVFDSLQNQTDKDFEWVIVDDGSKDDTAAVVNQFKTISKFPIEFYPKKMAGNTQQSTLG